MKALLQQLLTEQAEKRPDALAVVMNHEQLTYGQLEEYTNKLARFLREAGCKKGDRICFLVPKSPAAIISMVGILKADCVYVPLDTTSPAPRLARMIASCEPRWILATAAMAKVLADVWASLDGSLGPSISIGWMDHTGRVEGNSNRPLDYQNSPDDAAYILFTSGSMGIPKGVVITHSNVLHFIMWATKYFGMGPSDRISGHPPLHFDLSVFDVFGTFAAGAQLHLVPPEVNLLPNKLAEFMRQSELTQWFSVPSLLTYMAKFGVVAVNDFPALKRLLWCGEVFPTAALMYWMKRLPHVTFTNLYGPTEATIASSYYTVPKCPEDEKTEIPIGLACDGEQLLVLNQKLAPVAQGEEGQLYIRGVGLSPGYWRDPDKTREAFLTYPSSSTSSQRIYRTGDLARLGEDGLMYFRGRADFQIKNRGHRIELGEIEAALSVLQCLREAAVVANSTDGFEGTTICCAYVAEPGIKVTPLVLRKELEEALPHYMLPTRWMELERLPRNSSGKIDRRKLKEGFQANAA